MSIQLLVDPSHGSQLIGSRGSVVSELERGTKGRIAVERSGSGEKTVEVQGDARAKSDCFERIFNKLEDMGANMRDVCILIPPQAVTAIVGKSGSTVKRLQDETGAHINLPRKGSSDPGRVNITGAANAILRAMLGIDEIVHCDRQFVGRESRDTGRDVRTSGRDGRDSRDMGRDMGRDMRDVGRRDRYEESRRDHGRERERQDLGRRGCGAQIEFLLGGSLARALVGKGGAVVQGIERTTGSKVDVSKGQGMSDDENRIVSIRGGNQSEALKLALEKLEDTISEPIASVHFQVPVESASLIIGSRGATISGIQREANARVDVAKDEREAGTVTISGTIRQIVHAAEMVYDVVGSDTKTGGGGGRTLEPVSFKRPLETRGRSPPRQRPRKEGPFLELLIVGRAAPKLVGPGGSVVNQIGEESGAHVDVEKGNASQKSVIITGDTEARRRAVEMVLARLDEVDGLKEATMRIPVNLVTAVVGPKGSRVRQMEEDTHARIHIARRNGNETPGSVQIVGSLAHIVDAIIQIDAVINPEADRDDRDDR